MRYGAARSGKSRCGEARLGRVGFKDSEHRWSCAGLKIRRAGFESPGVHCGLAGWGRAWFGMVRPGMAGFGRVGNKA